ncbi:MAG: PKD domain-containing protein, partial [Flavobacteriales bacterium]|nr:PKD domain-containing protein [Flavobacteriales bacterium]
WSGANNKTEGRNGTAAGEAVVEGGVGSIYGGGANPDANDNSGIISYVRIEFGGIPFQPNSEINGLTMCGVGNGTTIDHVQVSYCGDDAFEWFGGNVNVKNIISYRNWDDDFDTDFGYRGNVQFALAVRDPQIADQSGSNGFESDNDASGSTATPNTQPHFSNVTIAGPLLFPITMNSNYKRALHLRRRTETSTFNSVFAGYPVGLLIESSSTQANATANTLRFKNNVIAQMNDSLACTTSANPNNVNGSFNITNFFNANSNALVNTGSELGWNSISLSNPDFSIQANSQLASGADFSDSYLQDAFFTPVSFRGAIGSEDWTSCWAEWDPQNADYSSAMNNAITATVSATGSSSICEGSMVTLNATSSDATSEFVWSNNGTTGATQDFMTAGNYSVTARNDKGCTATSNVVTVIVNQNPTVSISANGSTSFCTGGSVEITSSQVGGNVWNTNATADAITATATGDFSLEYTDANGCSASSNTISVNVSDSPIPTISANGSTSICDGTSVTLSASAADSYAWTFNGIGLSETTQTIDVTLEGLYTVNVTNADACNGVGASAPIFISVNATPTADASFTQTNGSYTVQFLNNSTNATSYSWNFGDGNTSTSANPSHTYATGGDFTVVLTATNGDCSNTFTINLTSVAVSENVAFEDLMVFPNPTENELNIQFSSFDSGIMNATIFNLAGQVVSAEAFAVNAGNMFHTIDTSNLESGVYFVNLSNNTSNITIRVIKK